MITRPSTRLESCNNNDLEGHFLSKLPTLLKNSYPAALNNEQTDHFLSKLTTLLNKEQRDHFSSKLTTLLKNLTDDDLWGFLTFEDF